jgi:type II secretory pathway pseudopilin PulG
MARRRAISLLEVLVVLAIIAVLFAIILPAVQIAREASLRAASLNNIRQIALAFHDYSAAHSGQLPRSEHFGDAWRSRLNAIVTHVDGPSASDQVKWLLSPADPTIDTANFGPRLCSYSMNWQIFKLPNASLPGSVPDGLSSTLLLAEMYSVCDGTRSDWAFDDSPSIRRPYFGIEFLSTQTWTWSYRWPDATFQIRPCAVQKQLCGNVPICYTHVAQTPHRGGMLVALADGSGRTISPNISATTYWDLVSPAGGENLGKDW